MGQKSCRAQSAAKRMKIHTKEGTEVRLTGNDHRDTTARKANAAAANVCLAFGRLERTQLLFPSPHAVRRGVGGEGSPRCAPVAAALRLPGHPSPNPLPMGERSRQRPIS
jgi:hypothetical protein